MSELAQLMCLNLLETCTTHNTATLGFYVLILGPRIPPLLKTHSYPFEFVNYQLNPVFAVCVQAPKQLQVYINIIKDIIIYVI